VANKRPVIVGLPQGSVSDSEALAEWRDLFPIGAERPDRPLIDTPVTGPGTSLFQRRAHGFCSVISSAGVLLGSLTARRYLI
jgi:hypothetical protein